MTRGAPIPDTVTLHVPFRIVKRGGRKEMQMPEGAMQPRRTDNALVKALARAFRWKRMLESGEFATIAELAEREGIAPSYMTRVLRLTLLAPDIVEAILDGKQGAGGDTGAAAGAISGGVGASTRPQRTVWRKRSLVNCAATSRFESTRLCWSDQSPRTVLSDYMAVPTPACHRTYPGQAISKRLLEVVGFQCAHFKSVARSPENKHFPIIQVKAVRFWNWKGNLLHQVVPESQVSRYVITRWRTE